MPNIVKCTHCYYLDYLDTNPKQCPKCGSLTEKMENPFEKESIKVQITNTRLKKYKIDVTFAETAKIVDNIISHPLKGVIADDGTRKRIIFMIKAYTWLLLKAEPQLWTKIDIVVNGIRELMTLRIEGGK